MLMPNVLVNRKILLENINCSNIFTLDAITTFLHLYFFCSSSMSLPFYASINLPFSQSVPTFIHLPTIYAFPSLSSLLFFFPTLLSSVSILLLSFLSPCYLSLITREHLRSMLVLPSRMYSSNGINSVGWQCVLHAGNKAQGLADAVTAGERAQSAIIVLDHHSLLPCQQQFCFSAFYCLLF